METGTSRLILNCDLSQEAQSVHLFPEHSAELHPLRQDRPCNPARDRHRQQRRFPIRLLHAQLGKICTFSKPHGLGDHVGNNPTEKSSFTAAKVFDFDNTHPKTWSRPELEANADTWSKFLRPRFF
jgi:hypothetical protein